MLLNSAYFPMKDTMVGVQQFEIFALKRYMFWPVCLSVMICDLCPGGLIRKHNFIREDNHVYFF